MSLRLIQRFGRSLTVTRPAVGSYVNGKFVPGTPSTFAIIGSPQPVTGDEQELFPEGNTEKDRRKVYTTSELKIQKSTTGPSVQEADRISIDGKIFQVMAVEAHLYPGKMTIQFYKAMVEEV